MKKEESNKEANFPICLLKIDRSDIESAVDSFGEDIQEQLRKISWDTSLMKKIEERIRSELIPFYFDCALLPDAIKSVLKNELEEMNSKRSFLKGLKEYIRGKK